MSGLLLAGPSGMAVGLLLGLAGGGGSILAVPLLVYAVGVSPAHVAIGTSALAVSVSALASLLGHARFGRVKWRCGLVFAAAGVFGALVGAEVGKAVDGRSLMALFGLLMIGVGVMTFRRRDAGGDADVRLNAETASRLLPTLVGAGFGTGFLSGFFGIGGGFLIVPALIAATAMPLTSAVGTSLIAVAAFGASTAASYAYSGLIDWPVALVFIAGGLVGSAIGAALSRFLGARKGLLGLILSVVITTTGAYVVFRSF